MIPIFFFFYHLFYNLIEYRSLINVPLSFYFKEPIIHYVI